MCGSLTHASVRGVLLQRQC